MKKIIIFNGPPNCGKDFASNAVLSYVRINANWWNPVHMKFSEPLKKGAHALYGSFHSWDYYDGDGRDEKNTPTGDFLGLSPRQAYIEMFNALERLHGPEALGYIMRKRIVRNHHATVVVCSDGGRLADLSPIIDFFGQDSVLVVEIHATGVELTWDNRMYVGDEVQAKYPDVTVKRIPNKIGGRADKDLFKILCQGTAKNWLKIEEKETA